MPTMHLVCPRCRNNLVPTGESLQCTSCAGVFPIVSGIPDLRLAPDPWIGMAEDRAKGIAVDAKAPPGLEPAVRAYWAITPTTSAADAARHIEHVMHAVPRTREWVDDLQPPLAVGEHLLDIGCGTADLACAVPDGVTVTGLDVAFRWLVIARRRLREAGRSSELICGNAETLPFADRTFDRVVSLGTLEHCSQLDAVLAEARRVLHPGGRIHLRTVNRFSLLSEPHVDLWGVGWFPRSWADRYVRWRGGGGYRHHHLKSAGELSSGLARAGFVQARVAAARMLAAEGNRLPRFLAPFVPVYDMTRRVPIIGRVLRTVAPLLDAEGVAP